MPLHQVHTITLGEAVINMSKNSTRGGYHPLCMLPRPHSGHVISRPWGLPTVDCPGEPKSAPAPRSGYTHCACRDCMETTVSSDTSKPELCEACREAGCEPCMWITLHPGDECKVGRLHECQRDDAYGEC